MPPPAHVSLIRHVSHVEIANMSFTRSVPVGAVLPASHLVVVSSPTHAHDVFLSTRGSTVTGNVVAWSSASGATAAVLFGREFAVTGFPLHRPDLSVSSSPSTAGNCVGIESRGQTTPQCTLHRLIQQAGGYADMERHVPELYDWVRNNNEVAP